MLIGYGTAGRRPASGGAGGRATPRRPALPPSPGRSDRHADDRVPRVISPLVRRLAHEHGVDLRALEGTGLGGLIVRGRRGGRRSPAAAPVPPRRARRVARSGARRRPPAAADGRRAADPAQRLPQDRRRRRCRRSRAEIPEATVWVDVDATALWELRESARTAADPGPGLLAYIARFVVAGLREHPVLNAPARHRAPGDRRPTTRSTSASPCRASAGSSYPPCSAPTG